ncbi:RNA polymerase sigma factor [Paenibacillus sp. B01]|uniref:RNA polymerase sigma factor n=1 Tax=Paenibacillus sp. B01 TaxID=2660554 RepID=UPI00129B9DC6|nr:sigma-70 family RNA polymerase sigma factor [Paenibacillus sp. B01]QGG57839.1 sigma-70 family RNA polymerase sigma factor [Paenibacillus sp. B01]
MAQKYQPIYEALIAGKKPDESLWIELLSHCRFEVCRRIKFHNFGFLENEDDIDRLVHDFGYAIARSIHRYDSERATFKTYINGIIDNMVIEASKQFNKRKREKSLEIFHYFNSDEWKNNSESHSILKEEVEELNEILKQLTTQQYNIVKLRLIENLSVEETALQLGISTKIVSNRLNKAKERIKALKEQNINSLKH